MRRLAGVLAGAGMLVAAAFPAAAEPRTLDQTLELAKTHPLVYQRAARVDEARGGLKVAKSSKHFTLLGDAEAGVQFYDEPGAHGSGGVADAGLTLTQPLLDGGQRTARVEGAESRVKGAEHNLDWQVRQRRSSAAEAHIRLWLAGELAKSNRQTLGALEQIASSTVARFRLKEATVSEVAEAQSRAAAARDLQAQREAGVGVAEADYLAAVGEKPVDLAVPPPMELWPAGAVAQVHPLVKAAQAARDEAAALLHQRKAGYWPTLDLRGSVRHDLYGGSNRDDAVTDGRLTLNAGYAFIDGGATKGGELEAMGGLKAAEAELGNARLQVEAGRQAASSRWGTAAKRLGESETSLREATRTVDLIMKEVKLGNRTVRELLDARRDMQGAMEEWLEAYAARDIAYYDLEQWR